MYNKTYELLSPTEKKSNRKEVVVNENVSIDYNYYNDLIYKYIKNTWLFFILYYSFKPVIDQEISQNGFFVLK